jgi:NAD(P)-dependent dehydrogenase (short-subunit alcohol dehydrogenase family)
VITGATSGIGRAAALALAGRGFDLFLIGRDEARGERVRRACRRRHRAGQIEFLRADLAVFADVRRVAAAVRGACDRVDVLINNAGARNDQYDATSEGIERTFAANHVGHFLLTDLLRPLLEKSSPGRVITVASSVHTNADLANGWIGAPERYQRHRAYANSKLANVVFARELAARADPALLVSNAVDPGRVATRFARNNGVTRWLKHIGVHAMRRELVSASRGAETVVYLAVSERGAHVTGGYLRDCEVVSPSALAQDPAVGRELWMLSERLVGLREMTNDSRGLP